MREDSLTTYGGQAVIEGVMMRGSQYVAIAMRNPEDEIVLHTEKLGSIYQSKAAKIPFVRGLVMLWDTLILGMRALTIPATAGHLLGDWLNITGPWLVNLVEGVVRILILIGYLLLIRRMEDIQRVFGYHGAEHKTINAFEDGADLTPEVVAGYSLEHPRCGTAFLLTVMIFSVLLFTLIGPIESIWVKLLTRVVLIPVLASISYEYIRWTARHAESPLVQALIKPNLALQRLTTNEPDMEMLEVAITSFNAMRALELDPPVL